MISPRPQPRLESSTGFTLLELLIAVIVFAIVVAVTAPAIASAGAQGAVRGAADRFSAKVSLARSVASRYGRTAQLRIDAAGDRLWVEIDTTQAGTGPLTTIGPVEDLSRDAVDVSSTHAVLCYDPRGLATQVQGCPLGNAVVTFARGNESRTVETTLSGKVLR